MLVETGSKAEWIEKNPAALWMKHKILRFLHFISFSIAQDENERRMAFDTNNPFQDCSDWHELDKVPDAGKVRQGLLVMHNGIRVLPTAYQGYGHGKLMGRALGIHEAQEERLFRDIIQQLPTGSSMMELGSYWAYYSLWFQQVITNARTFAVEPKLSHLNYGKRHFEINSFEGEFLQAGIGSESSQQGQLRIVTIDELMTSFALEKLSILHSDIQGFELDMLKGAEKALKTYAIDFFFISTHSDSLHEACLTHLCAANYKILDHYLISESWNPDGLIVAQSPMIPEIILKPASRIAIASKK
jgi:hypothetical protein